ncbi:NAD(P)/FAD-dependent oxidoreductase [Paraliomyxa miuraensis]|uniref:NAD(P)/FAD-dependent oxidoreductase n=1 Tax=Paraliomyxa miuraensis TaxID=376150 RepID=UPI00225902F7|nr:FAD-dependent monooxygenase [Paraliomyxa miuraensis]MCX4247188.1 FAD-dependent monooxygenase [Paraliomyxa miuraensis]
MRIAVVGAGPAGAAAGHHLARLGHEVILLDQHGFPRPKTCGDWITRGTLTELETMGLPWVRLRQLASQRAEIRGSIVGAPNGQLSHVRSEDAPSACVPRDVFDAMLVRRAVAAGCRMEIARVRDPATLVGEHDLVVDARGVYAGQPNTVAVRAYWTVPTNRIDATTRSTVRLHTIERFRMGYGWIFPVDVTREHVRINLGVGLWRAEHDARGIKIREDFERFVEENPVARRLATVAIEQGRTRGHHLALASERLEVAGHGVLRVGDAANLTDPITGEGITNAVLSGRLVAQAIDGARDPAQAQRRWQRSYDTLLWPELMAALRLRTLLLGTRRKNLAMWLLQRRPALAERFHGSLEGVVSYRDVLPLRLPEIRLGSS